MNVLGGGSGNSGHDADNDAPIDEAEDVVCDCEFRIPGEHETLEAYGYAATGEYITVVFVEIDHETIYMVTAFNPSQTRRRNRRKMNHKVEVGSGLSPGVRVTFSRSSGG